MNQDPVCILLIIAVSADMVPLFQYQHLFPCLCQFPRCHAPGNAGSPQGSDTPVNGNGAGTVGGGWIMPRYSKVPSQETGSIRLKATIDASGTVTKVIQTGGKTPASANRALVEACMAEVRQRRYTRTDSTPPPSATAIITYTFK